MTRADIPLTIEIPTAAGRVWHHEPVTLGLPLPKGLTTNPDRIALADAGGRELPIQAQATERWPDGSIRWLLAHFHTSGAAAWSNRYTVFVGGDRERRHPPNALSVDQRAGEVIVSTGVARFIMAPGTSFPFTQLAAGASRPLDIERSGLRITDSRGRLRQVRVHCVTVEDRGPLWTVVRVDGTIGPTRRPLLTLIARLHFFAGSAAVTLALTIRNPRRARHRGGIWELGDQGSIYVRDATLELCLSVPASSLRCSPQLDHPLAPYDMPLALYQDSSGGEHWDHVTHVNRHGKVPCTFRGYRVLSRGLETPGLRATPAVLATHARGSVGVALPHFWQNFPKVVRADLQAISVGLFPAESPDLHEIQGGEQKTHRLTLVFGEDGMARDALFWGRAPSIAAAAPEWYCGSGAIPYLSPACNDADDRYGRLVSAAVDGNDTFEHKRERIDEYGWRNFGDLYADHENAFSGESAPVVSHYNNQYDAIGGMACQFLRTGDRRWHRMMTELAAHVGDIDIYHTTRDKSAFNGGLFWHTAHYVAGGRSTHRSFPRHPRVNGGGPANEHNYTAGLRLHWLLTGDRQARESAVGLADWVIAMDDGRFSRLRWLSRGETGLASNTYEPSFHGPGRGAAHSMLALLDGHRLTGEARYLAKAEALIRRCIHPDDDIAALQLLDAERRWSYTVFLQGLGKYLDYKAERDERDAMYAYARAALLHYARWMAGHEYPYLDKPEILEFPTETWAAQDIRKAEVFLFAASHSSEAERPQLLERARFFFSYSLEALMASPTRTLTRPVVLLLSNGFMPLSPHAAEPRPAATERSEESGRPAVFITQKARAKGRLVAAAAMGTLALLAAAWRLA